MTFDPARDTTDPLSPRYAEAQRRRQQEALFDRVLRERHAERERRASDRTISWLRVQMAGVFG